MSATKEHNNQEEEISIRDLILKIQDYLRYFWRKKWWLVVAAAIGAAWFVYRGWDDPETFEGTLSFVVNEESGGGNAGFGSILGQIGLGGGSEDQQMAKVTYLSKSRRIINEMLLDSVELDGENDLIANHFIRIHNLKEWFSQISPTLADFQYTRADIDSFNRREFQVLKLLHTKLTSREDPLITIEYNEDSGIFFLNMKGYSEGITLSVLDRLYHNLNDFYVETVTGSKVSTLEELADRSDSLAIELNRVEYSLAQQGDRSLGLISQTDLVRREQLQREAALLNGFYLEVLRNKESADFQLKTTKPDFEIIENPAFPLSSINSSPKKNAVIGAFFGGFLAGFILLLIKAYRDIMSSND